MDLYCLEIRHQAKLHQKCNFLTTVKRQRKTWSLRDFDHPKKTSQETAPSPTELAVTSQVEHLEEHLDVGEGIQISD